MIGGVLRVSECAHALVDRNALHVAGEVLDHERHPGERTIGKGCGGNMARLIDQRMDHRVQLWIQILQAADRLL
jgi:hypothetical protein